MFELDADTTSRAMIKVIGIGGGGCNAVRQMVEHHFINVEFIFANTDVLELQDIDAHTVLQLGTDLTPGLGAGANPEVGRQAAIYSRDRIFEALKGADMVFIIAGMGGGTGTGGAPVVAEIARDMGILTVGVVTKPFAFEGRKRMEVADAGILELQHHTDSLITIPMEKLVPEMGKSISLQAAFKFSDQILLKTVKGIDGLINQPGIVNVDYADVRTVMSGMGMAAFGYGSGIGGNRAKDAVQAAIHNAQLEDIHLDSARAILVNVTASSDMQLSEFSEVGEVISDICTDDSTVVMGTQFDPDVGNEVHVSLYLTGIDQADSEVGHAPKTDNHKDINFNISGIRLVSPESVPDEELIELISHLSNLYKSVGGDELEVTSVTTLPPNPKSKFIDSWVGKLLGGARS